MENITDRKAEVLAFLRKVSGTPVKEVDEKAAKKLLQKFKEIDPVYISTNHNTTIKCFNVNGKLYRAYYNLYENTIIDEILSDKY